MSEEKIENPVSYDKLHVLEDDLEDIENEMLRHQAKLSADLYARRAKVVADIPNFWPLVLEQSPADIDEYIQPTDSNVLLNSLVDLSVDRFEIATGGHPRSLAIKLTFADNEYFSDSTLEKKFYWRYAKDGWSGYVSEPVRIRWKSPDKDLTQGMLDLVCRLRDAERDAGRPLADDAEPKKSLLAKMEQTGLGGVSFFALFGFCGRNISADESEEAWKVEQEKRQKRKAGEDVDDDDEDDDDDDDVDEYETEIFPTADDVAVCIAEDVWPNAIKYFLTAQENDALSDMDFEESDEEMGEANGDEHAIKKRKASSP